MNELGATRAGRRRATASCLLISLIAAAGCGGESRSEDLCGAVRAQNAAAEELGKLPRSTDGPPSAEFLEAVRKAGRAGEVVLQALPDDLRAELAPFAERLRTGDRSVLDDEAYRTASERAEQVVQERCGIAPS